MDKIIFYFNSFNMCHFLASIGIWKNHKKVILLLCVNVTGID